MISYSGFGYSDPLFSLFPVIFFLIFFIVAGVFVVSIVRGISQYSRNNTAPVLTVKARVAAKRADVSGGHGANSHRHVHTRYYATFEVESGDRMELSLEGGDFGLLVEGDTGELTFQGTRYLGFARGAGSAGSLPQ